MSKERPRRGPGGRPSKGARHSHTLRIPIDFNDEIETAFAASGYREFNAFLLDVLHRANQAGLLAEARAPQDQHQLKIGA